PGRRRPGAPPSLWWLRRPGPRTPPVPGRPVRAGREGLAGPAGRTDSPAHRRLDRAHPPRRVHLLRRVRRGRLRRDAPGAPPARGDQLTLLAHARRRLSTRSVVGEEVRVLPLGDVRVPRPTRCDDDALAVEGAALQ